MINERLISCDDLNAWPPAASCQSLAMLRLDKLHPFISGNKWYKLKHNIAAAKQQGKTVLLSFGGGYSNHLIATAVAAQECALGSIGIVRGIYEGKNLTPTLRRCEAAGMKLHFLDKTSYAAAKTDAHFAEGFPGAYIIPEGGFNEEGIHGAAEIAALIPKGTTDVCIAVGTGATFLGLRRGLPERVMLHGFYVAKDFERAETILAMLPATQKAMSQMHGVPDARFGKWTVAAETFIRSFYAVTGVPLDVVYTSKMMMAVEALLKQGFFPPQGRVVCVHTGGLQGNPGRLADL
jgi:1-aminocyclopropane-1-carboxylate deaminase